MGTRSRTAEEIAARLAGRAHGIVTRAELLAAGLTPKEIATRVRKGLLIPQYPGVYRVGHAAPSTEAGYIAAVKACGDGALLRGKPAGYFWAILKSPFPPPPEVLTSTERRPPGLKTKHTKRPDRRDATKYKGIPITTVPRTLVDLAAELSDEDLARACHEAGVKYRVTPKHVEAVLRRRPNAAGAAKLRSVISGDTKILLSKLEKRFIERLVEEDLPLPKTNRPAGTKRVDCRWPDHGLTVELDGFRFHNSRWSRDQDYDREREAYARRDQFRRYTYKDVFEEPARMLEELRELLT